MVSKAKLAVATGPMSPRGGGVSALFDHLLLLQLPSPIRSSKVVVLFSFSDDA